jgi:hypothetical protein
MLLCGDPYARGTKGQWLTATGQRWAHTLREGGRPHRRRKAATPGLLVPGPSQPGGQLAGAASGHQTRPHALRQVLEERPLDWLAALRPARWAGHVVELQRTPRGRQIPHQKNQ